MYFIFTYTSTHTHTHTHTLHLFCAAISVTFMCKSTRRNVKFNILEFETHKTEHRYRFVMQRQGA